MLYEVITIAASIQQVADEIAAGGHADQFPVDVFQTGSGTSTNMNANEVIARLASLVITSYSIHYTKLYEDDQRRVLSRRPLDLNESSGKIQTDVITSYSIHYTKLYDRA